jgi:hypothetical protein
VDHEIDVAFVDLGELEDRPRVGPQDRRAITRHPGTRHPADDHEGRDDLDDRPDILARFGNLDRCEPGPIHLWKHDEPRARSA